MLASLQDYWKGWLLHRQEKSTRRQGNRGRGLGGYSGTSLHTKPSGHARLRRRGSRSNTAGEKQPSQADHQEEKEPLVPL